MPSENFVFSESVLMLNAQSTRLKLSVCVAMIVLMSHRQEGAVLGLLFPPLFWVSVLVLCGDVEPKPGPTGKGDRMRQTLLGIFNTTSRAESGVHTEQYQEPKSTLLYVMTILQ